MVTLKMSFKNSRNKSAAFPNPKMTQDCLLPALLPENFSALFWQLTADNIQRTDFGILDHIESFPSDVPPQTPD